MVEVLRAVARFFQETIGWNRIGLALSIAIISIAAVVLFHMLRDTNVDEVVAALKATDPKHIAAAAFFVACGYFTLTFYDWFALRTIGRREIPYRIAALAGFTSYSIGHNIGATVFTGGAVRYRIYSAYGLDAIEVAKICFVAGLTFWLGNATVLGLGVSYHPQAAGPIDQLPDWLNRTVNIDTGCVFGGKLTALRYPEKEFDSVPAARTYCEPARPFLPEEQQAPRLTAQQAHDEVLDAEDVLGKRIVTTRLRGTVTIREAHATAALEVMSRFAANPKWLIYLSPTMSPCETSSEPGLCRFPDARVTVFDGTVAREKKMSEGTLWRSAA